jgi:hypothetical protein
MNATSGVVAAMRPIILRSGTLDPAGATRSWTDMGGTDMGGTDPSLATTRIAAGRWLLIAARQVLRTVPPTSGIMTTVNISSGRMVGMEISLWFMTRPRR